MSINHYFGSAVLGMHDALVSTLGLAAGLVIATYDNTMVLLTGIISSVAAAMSMAASQYLAYKTASGPANSFKYGLITGCVYILTAIVLLIPFGVIRHGISALSLMFVLGLLSITVFNLVLSHVCHRPFFKSWAEMMVICSIVTVAAFLVGVVAKLGLGITI